MRRIIYITTVVFGIGALTGCKGEVKVEEEIQEEACFYSYNEGKTDFTWTAFKTSDKVGVSGGFNDIVVKSEKFEDPKKVVESISFVINTKSVETNNEERNEKVSRHFFKTINTAEINGRIKSLGDNDRAIVEISMNGISFDVEGDYSLDHNAFAFDATIDVSSWNALSGIEALNEICKELHTGADGVSKLWSEVQLSLKTVLSSDCQ